MPEIIFLKFFISTFWLLTSEIESSFKSSFWTFHKGLEVKFPVVFSVTRMKWTKMIMCHNQMEGKGVCYRSIEDAGTCGSPHSEIENS